MDQLFAYGLQGVVAYGAVGVISAVCLKRGKTLSSTSKLYLLVGIAFGVGFVPQELGNMLFTRIKDAVAIALAISSANTALNKLGGN